MNVYTVISTDRNELDIHAKYEDCDVSASFMSEQALFDWYMDAFGGQAAESIDVDMIIDSLAGEYVIIEGDLISAPQYASQLDTLLGIEPQDNTEDPADKLVELVNEDDRFQIRDVYVTEDVDNILPPTDGLWLEEVALQYDELPQHHNLWFATELKGYLDSVATALSWRSQNTGLMPIEMQTRVRISTFLFKSAVTEHFDSGEAIDLLRDINTNIRDLTDDMAPMAYDH